MDFSVLQETLVALLKQRNKRDIRTLLDQMHEADFASVMQHFSVADMLDLLLLLSLPSQGKLFVYLSNQQQADIAELMDRNDLAALFSTMEADKRADLYNQLSEDQRYALLPGLAQAEREDVRRLASYPEKTAGAIMTSSYATLKADWTVKKALKKLRLEAPDKETIYQTYVIDEVRQLLGTVSLKELILCSPTALVKDLMRTEVVSISLSSDQEDVSKVIRKYDLLALPVLDDNQRLVGIVTYDDAMDAAEEEATEDAQKSASVSALDTPMSQIGFWELYRKRVGWLVLLVFGALLSGAGLAFFEDTIAAQIALVFFMPLLVGSGGNAGSQAAALMVRALATGDVEFKDWAKVLGRDAFVASALGLTMGATVYLLGLLRGGPEIAIVVAISMFFVVVVGSLIGLCLPFILSKLKMDPATASGPLVTTIVDASGVLIYFGFATLLLGMDG
ncbi:magnesium transporter [Echinimonas agarilytica]|uniref:Magnesium transporter MgtE n=1 Tax=Echinimonas agarilytica TaxID=1215918 RepID=A0AA41W5B2_9GAMM|nr:magnesium transporter [Echinimonas agarilytica]MCM2679201.1 magnesium transporter [Echinimonas agarilytica]